MEFVCFRFLFVLHEDDTILWEILEGFDEVEMLKSEGNELESVLSL